MAEQEFVTKKEFDNKFDALTSSVGDLVGLVKQSLESKDSPVKQSPEAEKAEKDIAKAGPNKYTENPEWEEIARDIIGEAVDHTEVEYVKGGGMKFTVVIKNDHSNASIEYLERHGTDRRSKEVGSEGEAGVREWCIRIRDNLKRERPVNVE